MFLRKLKYDFNILVRIFNKQKYFGWIETKSQQTDNCTKASVWSVSHTIKKYRSDLLTVVKDKADDKTTSVVKVIRTNNVVPFEQASHPAENKKFEKPVSKKSDNKDSSKSGIVNKHVM